MGFSPLANMARRIPHGGRQTPRGTIEVTGVGIHHNAGVNAFGEAQNPRRSVSANYWITNEGEILPNIDENYRAWTSGHALYPQGAQADFRNITIEVSNTPAGVRNATWEISPAAMSSLIRLVAEIYRRRKMGQILRSATRGVGVHSDWVATECPGPYVMANLRHIIADAEKLRMDGSQAPKPAPVPKAPTPYSGDAKAFVGHFITTTTGWWNYLTAADAKALRSARRVMPAGRYRVSSVSDGQPHLVSEDRKHSGWVHSSVLTGQTPPKKPITPAPKFETIRLTTGWWNYKTAADAKNLKRPVKVMPPGLYEITKRSGTVPHLRNVNGKHSGWVHPSVFGGPEPVKPAPKKSIAQMALEVIAGKHGIGHANRQRSLGVNDATYAKVRAEVNRRV